jgi:hypothetical protein
LNYAIKQFCASIDAEAGVMLPFLKKMEMMVWIVQVRYFLFDTGLVIMKPSIRGCSPEIMLGP